MHIGCGVQHAIPAIGTAWCVEAIMAGAAKMDGVPITPVQTPPGLHHGGEGQGTATQIIRWFGMGRRFRAD
jgi:hypothetical protein